jgi:endonuclease/exonuclease/phosphatase family metal-dependent hydrolase
VSVRAGSRGRGKGRAWRYLASAPAGGLIGLLLLTSAWSDAPPPRLTSCDVSAPSRVTLSPDGRTAHLRLDVMTYNLEGLAWPVRDGRAAELAEIGRRLAALREAGEAPDVIVFQEMFSGAAVKAVRAAGYPEEVAGPSPWTPRDMAAEGAVPGSRLWRKGELGFSLVSGGLAIVSRYPITAHRAEPFSRGACAGLDCLSNKGVLFAEVAVPGAPDPVRIFDSHMNSKHRSAVALARAQAAHGIQAKELADFLAQNGDSRAPVVLAGDFNMRHSQPRFAAFEAAEPMTVVQDYCLRPGADCDVRIAWSGRTPWLDTEDLQFFRSGDRVAVRPVRVGALFAGGPSDPQLSDHKALRVTYDLSWPAGSAPAPEACPAAPPASAGRTLAAEGWSRAGSRARWASVSGS